MQYNTSNIRRPVIIWLWTGAGLVLLMLVIGGITRLTGSGLSMTDWNLFMGAIPPTDHAGWVEAFNQYKQFPEYQQLKAGMTLAEFKDIYFWEYLHRVAGRLIGIVFIFPFLWFWYRGYLERSRLKSVSILFVMGALQGAMGWIMVKSGLSELPYVSHYRLAAHLVLAALLFGYCVWLALDLSNYKNTHKLEFRGEERTKLLSWMHGIAAILFLQIIWGAFVAGLDAGFIYNSFPMMNEDFMPRKAWALEPLILNFLENPGLVQWSHRIIGTVLIFVVLLFWIRTSTGNTNSGTQYRIFAMLLLISFQYVLGIFTLVYNVPIALAIAHQVLALLVWGAWIVLYHHLKREKKISDKFRQKCLKLYQS